MCGTIVLSNWSVTNCPVSPLLGGCTRLPELEPALSSSNQAVGLLAGADGELRLAPRTQPALEHADGSRSWANQRVPHIGMPEATMAMTDGWDRALQFMRKSSQKASRHHPLILIYIWRQTTSKQWRRNVGLLLN